jgi:hypothetical protein
MEFLLSHWHCILPAAGIVVALLLMRDRPADKQTKGSRPPAEKTDRPITAPKA